MTETRENDRELELQSEVLEAICAAPTLRLTVNELERLVSEGCGEKLVDDVEIAVRELVRYGLAHREADFVFPSVAAQRFRRLPPLC